MTSVGPIVPGIPSALETPSGPSETKDSARFGLALLMAIGLPAPAGPAAVQSPSRGGNAKPEGSTADGGAPAQAPAATPVVDASIAALAGAPALVQMGTAPPGSAAPSRASGGAGRVGNASGNVPAQPPRLERIASESVLQAAWAEALAARKAAQVVPADAGSTAAADSAAEPIAQAATTAAATPAVLAALERAGAAGEPSRLLAGELPLASALGARVESVTVAAGQGGARSRFGAGDSAAGRPHAEQARAATAGPQPTPAPNQPAGWRPSTQDAAPLPSPATRTDAAAAEAGSAARVASPLVAGSGRPAARSSTPQKAERASAGVAREATSGPGWPGAAAAQAERSGEPDVGSTARLDASHAAEAPRESAPAPRSSAQATIYFEGEHGLDGRLRVAVRGESLRATIVAPDADAAKRIEGDLGALQQALRDRGFAQATVTVRAASAEGSPPPSPGQRSEDRSPANERTPDRDERAARRDGTPQDAAQERHPRDVPRNQR